MFDREDVELALMALEEGWSTRAAGALVGASSASVSLWSRGMVPHGRRAARGGGKVSPKAPATREVVPLTDDERAAYEAAMTENQLLRAVLDDLKAEGSDPRSISNRRKVECGERLRRETGLPLREITAFLRISRSSYEYQRARLGRDRDGELRPLVREAFEAGRGCYGYRRVHAELAGRGVRVSEKRVRRVMREEGLEARRPRRRRRYSSYRGEPDERPANVPRERAEARRAAGEDFAADHDFSAAAPGELAVTDVTEFAMDGYRCYLSPLIDLFDGMPCSWGLSTHPDSALCDGSLGAYLDSLPEGASPVVHTDGGGPYRAGSWKAACSLRGVTRSMSRPGRSGDNAPAEGFFGTLKVEFFEGRDWAGVGLGEFRALLDGYLEWYRDGRLKRFREPDGTTRYETIAGRRRRLGLMA